VGAGFSVGPRFPRVDAGFSGASRTSAYKLSLAAAGATGLEVKDPGVDEPIPRAGEAPAVQAARRPKEILAETVRRPLPAEEVPGERVDESMILTG
jgi:hypothetical protein